MSIVFNTSLFTLNRLYLFALIYASVLLILLYERDKIAKIWGIWKSLQVLQKARRKTVARINYTYLFLLYINSHLQLENKKLLTWLFSSANYTTDYCSVGTSNLIFGRRFGINRQSVEILKNQEGYLPQKLSKPNIWLLVNLSKTAINNGQSPISERATR